VLAVRAASAQLDIEGEAILFASGAYARMPEDMPDRLALAVLDVAGAAPQVARLAKPGASVCIFGAGGKSGILCAAEARRSGGASARIIGIESHAPYADDLRALGICDEVLSLDARDPVAVRNAVLAANGGREVDLALSCVNVTDAEMSAILVTRDRGVAYFFAMSTSFTKSALGAEGVGKDIDLMIGNGFAHGHADHSLEMMRSMPAVRALFEKRYT
jgi:L-erythro-3,5-diaminohexanoate dehydrogenase